MAALQILKPRVRSVVLSHLEMHFEFGELPCLSLCEFHSTKVNEVFFSKLCQLCDRLCYPRKTRCRCNTLTEIDIVTQPAGGVVTCLLVRLFHPVNSVDLALPMEGG